MSEYNPNVQNTKRYPTVDEQGIKPKSPYGNKTPSQKPGVIQNTLRYPTADEVAQAKKSGFSII